jgi:hypothetical protein
LAKPLKAVEPPLSLRDPQPRAASELPHPPELACWSIELARLAAFCEFTLTVFPLTLVLWL